MNSATRVRCKRVHDQTLSVIRQKSIRKDIEIGRPKIILPSSLFMTTSSHDVFSLILDKKVNFCPKFLQKGKRINSLISNDSAFYFCFVGETD